MRCVAIVQPVYAALAARATAAAATAGATRSTTTAAGAASSATHTPCAASRSTACAAIREIAAATTVGLGGPGSTPTAIGGHRRACRAPDPHRPSIGGSQRRLCRTRDRGHSRAENHWDEQAMRSAPPVAIELRADLRETLADIFLGQEGFLHRPV